MKKNFNFQFLRVILCILVVYRHTYKGTFTAWGGVFYSMSTSAVPVFMILSFYLTAHYIQNQKNMIYYIKKRNVRLLVPHIGWAVIAFILLKPIRDLHVNNLLMQLVCGKGVNGPLWFIFDMWIITNIFFAIGWRFRDRYIYVIVGLLCFSLIMQYTGLNYYIFQNASGEIKGTYGTLLEVLPYASLGIIFWRYDLVEPLQERRYLNLLLIAIIFIEFFVKGSILHINNFGYGGGNLIVTSCLIFLFAYLFPLDWLPDAMKRIIEKIADYTFGIYCIHLIVFYWGDFLCRRMNVEIPYPIVCFFLFGICLLLSIAIAKISNKYCKMLVC